MTAKNPPKAAPVAAFTGVVIALLFIASPVVGVHDLSVAQGWAGGSAWARAAIDATNGATRADWVIPLAVVALVLGALLLLTSLRPRRVTHRHVPDDSGSADVWIVPAALGRMAASAAEDVPGVLTARPRATARRMRLNLQTVPGADRDQITEQTTKLVTERLGHLSDLPIKVSVQEVGK